MGKKIKMMISHHPHMKSTPNLNFVIFESFRNSKYHFKISNFESHLVNVNGS